MSEVGAIGKSRKNQQQGYSFRGIDDAYNALHGPLSENGVFIVPAVTKREVVERQTAKGSALFYTTLHVDFTLYAPDGSSVIASTVGEAMDMADKSSNKAMSAAMKYMLLQVFCIPTEEPKDTENDSPEVASQAAPAQTQQRRTAPPPARQQSPAPARRESIDKSTGEVEPDDVAAFRNALYEAFKERQFMMPLPDQIVAGVCEKKGVASLGDLPEAERVKFLKSLREGKMDHLKLKKGSEVKQPTARARR